MIAVRLFFTLKAQETELACPACGRDPRDCVFACDAQSSYAALTCKACGLRWIEDARPEDMLRTLRHAERAARQLLKQVVRDNPFLCLGDETISVSAALALGVVGFIDKLIRLGIRAKARNGSAAMARHA